MEKESYIIKILNLFGKLFSKLSWTEVIILCLIIIGSMTYIKVNVATYHVECDDGSVVEIHHGITEACDQLVDFNAYTGRAQVVPKPKINYNITLQ